jgi:predicted dehydrogenase
MALSSSSPSPIGVAIAGLGFGESVHLKALASQPDLQAVALWHPRRERLDQACLEHNLPGYDDWEALLSDPRVQAVIIATPPEPRFALALQALKAGKHLLLEKPVALKAELVAELQRVAIQNRLSVAVDYEYRAVPLFMQAARMLEAGAVGTPWLVKLDWLMSSRADASRPWSWYSQRDAGGGVLGALGTHAFDMLAWLVGPIRSVQGLNSVSIKERPHPSGGMASVDAEDVSLIQMQLDWTRGFQLRSIWRLWLATAEAAGSRSTDLMGASLSVARTKRIMSMALGCGIRPWENPPAILKRTLSSSSPRPGVMAVWHRWPAFRAGGLTAFKPVLPWCLAFQRG